MNVNPGNPQDPRSAAAPHRVIGRFAIHDIIASGGMATVHFGRMTGAVGFSKTVAVKRLHPHLASNPDFVAMLVDEARLAARVQHPNVVATLDVLLEGGEVLIVLEYVHGESLWHLLTASAKRGYRVAPSIVSAIVINALHGLHAAHEASDEHGEPLGLVHRDVSPQNILIGVDGIARVLDFGVAKATGRLQSTHDGQLKGKLAYMAPEQVQGRAVDRRTDIYGMAAVLWGALAGRRLVDGDNEAELIVRVVQGGFPPPSAVAPGLSPQLDAIVMSGLAQDPVLRFQTARDMALALESVCPAASPFEVAEWVKSVGAEALALRSARVREMESRSDVRVSQDVTGRMVVRSGFDPSRSGVVSATTATHTHVTPAGASYESPSHPATLPLPLTAPMTLAMPTRANPPSQPPSQAPPVASAPFASATPFASAASAGSAAAVAAVAPVAPQPPAGSATRLVVTALASILVTTALVVAGYVYVTRRPKPTTIGPTIATSARAEAVASPTPPAVPAPTAPAPATIPVQDLPTAAPRTGARAANDPAAPGPVAVPRTPATNGRTGGKAKPNCDSPFYVDSEGIKQIRPECM